MSTKPSSERFVAVSVAAMLGLSPAFAAEDLVGQVSERVREVPGFDGHRFELGLRSTYRSTTGRFDPYGNYSDNPGGASSRSTRTQLSSAYRFDRHWEGGVNVSLSQSRMATTTGQATSYSLGSPTLQARYLFGGRPNVSARVGATLPMRRSVRHVEGDPMKAFEDDSDSTGDLSSGGGTPSAGFGVGVSNRLWQDLRGSASADVSFPFARSAVPAEAPLGSPEVSVRGGAQFQVGESLAYVVDRAWTVAGGLRQSWGLDRVTDGLDDPGTATRRFTTTIGLSYGITESWTCAASYETLFPFYAFEVKQPYGTTASLGLTYRGF